jgi:GH43 family beta-xylosidase
VEVGGGADRGTEEGVRRAALLLALAACGGGGGGDSDAGDDHPDYDAGPPIALPGFRAEYFADYRLLVVPSIEPSVDHAWADGEPVVGVGADRFSARFTATLDVPVAGTYMFATVGDDGVRLRVGDTRVIDDWRGHFAERHEGMIDLPAGPVELELEYFEYNLDAELHLYWTPPGGTESLLDATHVVAGDVSYRAPKPPYANPVIDVNCPDPGVIAVGDAFYAICTGGHFGIRRSYDLVRWEDTGAVVLPDGKPAWAANGGRNWAPEMHRVGDRFVVYYTSVNGANVLSIGATSSDSPTGPFVDRGSPLVEDAQGVIDASYIRDTDGAHYLLYKIDGNAHGAPTPIYLRRLADDGLSFAEGSEPVELIRNNSATWEGGVVEAPWIIVEDGTYYLFYSGNVYDGRYRTGVARASSITGPYEKHGDPILANDDAWVGPGHGSVVRVGDLPYFVYHAWHNNGSGGHDSSRGRVVLVDRIRFEDGWPRIADGTPSTGPQPWPGVLE